MSDRCYRFEKWGMLTWHEGLPVFLGRQEITPHGIVWWFPWNWVLFLVAALIVVPFKAIRKRFKR